MLEPLNTLALYGASFAGLDRFIAGLKAALPEVRILWLDSGPLAPFLAHCDAVIWLHDEARKNIPLAVAAGKPVLGRSVPFLELGVPVLHMDDETPALQMAEAMIKRGAKRLGYWGVPRLFSARRAHGVRSAAAAAGVPFTETTTLEESIAWLRSAEGPSGLVCMNDERGYRVEDALAGSGLLVGRDILLAGFDNLPPPVSSWMVPLTTTVLPLEAQGRLAGKLLLSSRASGQPIACMLHLTPLPEVLFRASTGLHSRVPHEPSYLSEK